MLIIRWKQKVKMEVSIHRRNILNHKQYICLTKHLILNDVIKGLQSDQIDVDFMF